MNGLTDLEKTLLCSSRTVSPFILRIVVATLGNIQTSNLRCSLTVQNIQRLSGWVMPRLTRAFAALGQAMLHDHHCYCITIYLRNQSQ